jgi:hypothetical protein
LRIAAIAHACVGEAPENGTIGQSNVPGHRAVLFVRVGDE